jgi:hypothetical protein
MQKSTKSPESERRKYQRFPGRFELTCAPFRLGGFALGLSKCVTKNIGAGGVLIESRKRLALSELLKLEIRIPGWERFKSEFYHPDTLTGSNPLIAIGKVVWVSAQQPDAFETGIQFMGIDDGHQWGLMKYINNRLTHDPHL